MSTETLHFRVGADMGRTLMQIAHEHFIYSNDFDKAMRTLELGEGCDEAMQIKLLTGELIILVDEDSQQFIVTERSEHPELDKIYPKIDIVEYAEKLQKEFDDRCADLKEGLNNLVRKFDGKHSMTFNFSSEAVMLYIYGNDSDMIEELREDYELQQWQFLIKMAYEFIKTSIVKAEMVRKFARHLDIKIDIDTYKLTEIQTALQKIACLDFEPMNLGTQADVNVQNYLDATKEIDEVISAGITPVDIMDNYSAGWLSPEGEYYALNGEIANMLHIQIADALQEKGLIPMYDNDRDKEIDIKVNPDSWLEQQGWVKIHGNNVHFAGNLNKQMGTPIVHITEKQIEIIRDYITDCHQCLIKAGWRLEKTSIGMFTSLAMSNKIALYKKYFDF